MKKLMLILILLFFPQIVSASVISLTTTITTNTMIKNTTKVNVELLNSGDEAAYNVQISLITDKFESNPIYGDILNPNVPFEGDFNVSLKGEILPGNYPVVVLVDYADANGYPSSSISSNFITYKKPTVSKIFGVFSELTLIGRGTKKLTLTLRNLDDFSHDLNVKLILPRELKVINNERTISIQPKEEKQLNFEVSSFSALPGSSYVVLASIEYEGDSHYSSFANGTIKIGKGTALFEFFNWLPIIIVVVLILIFIFYQFRGKKK